MNKETATSTLEKRLAIDIRVAKTYMEDATFDLRWLPAEFNISDVLTKTKAPKEYLRHVMRTGRLSLASELPPPMAGLPPPPGSEDAELTRLQRRTRRKGQQKLMRRHALDDTMTAIPSTKDGHD